MSRNQEILAEEIAKRGRGELHGAIFGHDAEFTNAIFKDFVDGALAAMERITPSWRDMTSAPKDRPIIVAGGTYHYKKESDRYGDRNWRTAQWDGKGFKHASIRDRYEHPDWWIDALPPVPTKANPAKAAARNPREE